MVFLLLLLLLIGLLFPRKGSGYRPWSPSSWRRFPKDQIPDYPDPVFLNEVETELRSYPPLVYAGECRELKRQLAKAGRGEKRILMIGDCAESFDDFSIDYLMRQYRHLLRMSLIFMSITNKPVVNIARIAGQFAKPRSSLWEHCPDSGIRLPAYQGDIINGHEFSMNTRVPEPYRMIMAYHQSCQTLNLLRAFHHGKYGTLSRVLDWNRETLFRSNDLSYRLREIESNIQFLQNIMGEHKHFAEEEEEDRFHRLGLFHIYTGHEGLLLPYEEALTRRDSITHEYYDCSSHFVWIGERTRNISHAHVEYIRGIQNPIGIKISAKYDKKDIRDLIEYLNPLKEEGKITLIIRMGCDAIREQLLPLVQYIDAQKYPVQWVCDPMHGNTKWIPAYQKKTRYVYDIKKEIEGFVDVLGKHRVGGFHLESCGDPVTECIGYEQVLDLSFASVTSDNHVCFDNYQSKCDPRLNDLQSLELLLWMKDLVMTT